MDAEKEAAELGVTLVRGVFDLTSPDLGESLTDLPPLDACRQNSTLLLIIA